MFATNNILTPLILPLKRGDFYYSSVALFLVFHIIINSHIEPYQFIARHSLTII